MKTLFLIFTSCLLISCGSSQNMEVSTNESKVLDELVAQKRLEIISDWASPIASASLNELTNSVLFPPGSTASNISLSGNLNHFRMIGDSISIYLPYYGERQISAGFNNKSNNIEFDGVPEHVKVTYNEKKQRYLMNFKIRNATEWLRVSVTLYPNLRSDIIIHSNYRTSIRYRGNVLKLEEKNNTAVSNN
ncbi:DUF4251 domain-containing protein [Aquimarina sp. MAR_2010_214]|uniref:DUF4251 domain-containing protein n=1 Tax=Aquimarina sp. MAR_2010_214 TaxID=1250026 RepID=UPI0013047471|nr:DUF4251 domain-containing protein [Aquimarina sp. MAR_2010_214]